MIERAQVEKLADLSMLTLSSEEVDALKNDMGAIVDYISQLSAVSVDSSIVPVSEVKNVFREDVPTNAANEYTEAILENAPRRVGSHIAVKKIL